MPSNDPSVLQSRDLRRGVAEFGQHEIGVLAQTRRPLREYSGRGAQFERQSRNGHRPMQTRKIGYRMQEFHGGHLRVVERLLRGVDGSGGKPGLIECRERLLGGSRRAPLSHSFEYFFAVRAAGIIGSIQFVPDPSCLIAHEFGPTPKQAIAHYVSQRT
jgi:hypothetical protein